MPMGTNVARSGTARAQRFTPCGSVAYRARKLSRKDSFRAGSEAAGVSWRGVRLGLFASLGASWGVERALATSGRRTRIRGWGFSGMVGGLRVAGLVAKIT